MGTLMASSGDRKEPEWIDRIISEGAVPLLEPHNCSNGWASPPGDAFMVRGPEYFTTRVKIRAGDYLLRPLGGSQLGRDFPTFFIQVLKKMALLLAHNMLKL